MKLVKWFLKQKDDKTKLIYIIFTLFLLLFALFLLVFDIVQIIKLQQTGTIANNFMIINLWGIFLAGVDLIYYIVLLILSNKQVKSK